MNDTEIKSVIEGLDEITGYSCEQMSLFDNDVFIRKMANDAISVIRELKEEKQPKWISVDERLPENAQHKGTFCPRYRVYTKWGETFGWYNPDKGCWYFLLWYLEGKGIDFERGDNPKVAHEIDGAKVVTHWMPLSEPPKEVEV